MATIDEVCVFFTEADQVKFHTQTNGDNIHIKNLRLTQDQATTLAWLVNHKKHLLEFTVKVKGGRP